MLRRARLSTIRAQIRVVWLFGSFLGAVTDGCERGEEAGRQDRMEAGAMIYLKVRALSALVEASS